MAFIDLAHARYSVRKFSSAPVEPEKVEKILEAGIIAPTAKNAQPVRIWVIESDEALEKVRACTSCHFDAPVVFAVGGKRDDAWIRPSDGKSYVDVDASIVATHMMLEIHDLGLGSTWVGWFDAPALAAAFPEMEPYEMVALLPVGYPADDAEPTPRHEQYKPYDELVGRL